MSRYKCTRCFREWDGKLKFKCPWCGASGEVNRISPDNLKIKEMFDEWEQRLKSDAASK